jgi:hypothetical protein
MRHHVWLVATLWLALMSCSPQQVAAPPLPAVPQPAVVLPVVAPPVAVTSAADQGPPTINGIYIEKGACPGEGCYLKGKIKAREAVSLYQEKRSDSPVLATIEPDEWVEILGTEDRLVPLAGKDRATGEVVYLLGYEGEGCSTLWNKGKLSSWCDNDGDLSNDSVVWSTPAESTDTSLGFWVNVKRANGQAGWLGEDGNGSFACSGYQDRDPDCPPLP